MGRKCVFWFCIQFLSKKIIIQRGTERNVTVSIINVHRYSYKIPVSLARIKKNWIFSTDFEKLRYIRLHENPSSMSWFVPCWRVAFRSFEKSYLKKKFCAKKRCLLCWCWMPHFARYAKKLNPLALIYANVETSKQTEKK